MYHIYFAKSLKNNKIYVGFTAQNPEQRLIEHNKGFNTWSKNNRPLVLIYFESFACKEDAQAKEKFYKTGIGRKIKNAIVNVMSS